LYWEGAICFGFSNNVLYMTIIVLLSVIVFLFLNMGIFCVLRNSHVGKDIEEKSV